ncbi:DNA-binding protein [bacterium]|nr:MAG: DNA-binding protein [bacterium]
MPDSEIMTVADVARYLKLKPQTIYKWAQEGKIPAAKLGKEWRFRRSVIDAWLDAQIAESPAMKELEKKNKG